MKKYISLGELLVDYREENNLSQAGFAASVNVDTRTVQRWEKDLTLIKPDKEEDIVIETMLPYQLIRNLNAAVVIPTFYDFKVRKYSLTSRTNTIPNAALIREQINLSTRRVRPIDPDFDFDYILRFLAVKKNNSHLINKQVLTEVIKRLPEINLIITDDSGYYSGHSLFFPITLDAYNKLKSREISKEQLTIHDLGNPKTQDRPVFLNYDITADCNDNMYYLISPLFTFFDAFPDKGYLYCGITSRYDTYELNKQNGNEIIWEDDHDIDSPQRFYTGASGGGFFPRK